MIDTIKIGPITYDIKEVPRLIGNNGDGSASWLNGRARYEKALLEVEQELAPDVKAACVLHESMHAILDQAGMEEHPEPAIRALGYGMLALIRDNPDLVKYITQEAAHDAATQTSDHRED